MKIVLIGFFCLLPLSVRAEVRTQFGVAVKAFARERTGITLDLYSVKLSEPHHATRLRLNVGVSLFQRTAHDYDRALIGVQANLSYGCLFMGLNFNDTRAGDAKFIAGVKF